MEKIGRFTICPEGLTAGNKILTSITSTEYMIAIVDEVGLLELGGKGWADSLGNLLEKSANLLIVVRDSFVERVKAKWHIIDSVTFNIRKISWQDAGLIIAKSLKA
jgi:nucleoside-triphosphatase THEP1